MPEPPRNAMPFAGPPCSWCQVPTGAAGRGDRSRTGHGRPACLLAERQSDHQKQPGRPLFHQMRDSGVTCSFNKGLLSACFAADSLRGAGHSRAMTGLLCSNGADVRGSRRQTLNHQTLLLACARAEHTGRTAGSPERQTWRWRGAGRGGCGGPRGAGLNAPAPREPALGLRSTGCVRLPLWGPEMGEDATL